MNRTLQSRVARIEAAAPDASWADLSLEEMTDEMLEAFLRRSLLAEGIEPPATFTDEYLRTITVRKAT